MKKLSSLILDIFSRLLRVKPFTRFFKKYKLQVILFLVLVGILCVEGLKTLDFQGLIDYKRWLLYWVQDHPLVASLSFFLVYMFLAILSLPGSTILSFIGGFLFGFVKGTLFSVFALSFGSGISFLLFRFFFRDLFIKKGRKKMKRIYMVLKKDEVYYLFAFRMFPFIPLFLATITMGLSSIKFTSFYVISFIAFLPLVGIYVNMGTQISQLEDIQGLMAPNSLIAFSLIGIFPLCVKYLFKFLKKFKKSDKDLSIETGSVLTN